MDVNNIELKFNFYDLAGYFIPGTSVLILLYWFVIGFLNLGVEAKIDNFGSAVALLAVSYGLGNVVQAFGNVIERHREKRWGGNFADTFLRVTNTHYPPEFTQHLRQLIEQVFHLPLTSGTTKDDAELQKRARLEAFQLCHALISQERSAQYTDIFQGIYGLYRGLIATAWIGVGIVIAIGAKQFMLWLLLSQGVQLPHDSFFSFDMVQLEASGVVLLGLIVGMPLMGSRLKRFSQHYVDSVYRGFYAWCARRGIQPTQMRP